MNMHEDNNGVTIPDLQWDALPVTKRRTQVLDILLTDPLEDDITPDPIDGDEGLDRLLSTYGL